MRQPRRADDQALGANALATMPPDPHKPMHARCGPAIRHHLQQTLLATGGLPCGCLDDVDLGIDRATCAIAHPAIQIRAPCRGILDEGAAPALANDETLAREFIERLADGSDAHAELP